MTEPTKPTTRTKQYRLDVLGGRATRALTDGLAAKDEAAFYELKDKLEEALGNWADENWPLGGWPQRAARWWCGGRCYLKHRLAANLCFNFAPASLWFIFCAAAAV